ncbi:beta-lactamase/transpeptidase-like protein [Mycena alexandri]|uniref:Beta-lactamase/transpeptidase-like protein n=1 Tax=Mycena alexandri TaxID=1745969 RepID=A0AAD6WU54_9AGAR|nr:beta-lactamase/transpeptidase-like protein [Mycena alexandri]
MFFLLQAVLGSAFSLVFLVQAVRLQQPFDISNDSESDSHTKILNAKVDAAINSILKDFKSPGGAGVAVVQKSRKDGWMVETKGYGVAKVDGTKVTSETLFGIGSNSKLFDILATGLLISNDSLSPRISWDTKIASFVPEWGLMDPIASSESTIVDVMSHRTGLPRHDIILQHGTVADVIRRLRYLKPSTGFRELWQYNNHMYSLLSYFPPLLAGVPFETYVNKFILAPLGMDATTYYSKAAEESGHLADGFGRDGVNQTEDVFGQGQVRAYPYWAPNEGKPGHVISGAGGLISNAKDMAIWLQTLLEEGQNPCNGETVIPVEVIRRVSSGITVAFPVGSFPEGSPVVYGGGQSRGSYRGFEYIEHGGAAQGFKSQITRIPSQDFGVAVLSNDEAFGRKIVEAIKFRIIDEALNLEVIDWTERFKSLIVADFKGRTMPTPRPTNSTLPSFSFSDLTGTYQDPGHGSLHLCLVAPRHLASKPCRQLMDDFRHLPLDPRLPTLLANWKGFGVSHLALTHFEHNLFNVTALSSMPTGNASDSKLWVQVETHPSFVGEFAIEGKLGVGFRGFWGAGAGVESPKGESVKERAEVWFEKSS